MKILILIPTIITVINVVGCIKHSINVDKMYKDLKERNERLERQLGYIESEG